MAPEEPATPKRAGPRPLIAAIANLLVAPLGHIYVGATRRGVTMAVVLGAVAALTVVLAVRSPGLATVLLVYASVVVFLVTLTLDAFRLARMRRSDPTWRTRPWHRLLLLAIAVLAASEGVKVVIRFEARAYRIPSASMSPTLLVGDFLYAEMATYRAQLPGRGDVVIYRYPGNPALEYVHRVVGLPNETIEVRNKQVFIDGLPLDETYVHHDDPAMWPSERGPRDQFGPFRIPADAVFVMGDQRDNSNDSRFWGPLRVTRIRGLARVLYWSWDGGTPRWERIGRPIE